MTTYEEFLERKTHRYAESGFDPVFMPPFLFDFQKALVEWAVRKGRAAIFADCGLGKTAMQLVWAQNVVEKTNRRILLLTPLAVGAQTQKEAEKFGIHAKQSRDGKLESNIVIANYERLHYFNPEDFAGVVCDESSILKNYSGDTRKAITRFMSKMSYRLLCTATAAPNDYVELGTSSEALGELNHSDMLKMFFAQSDDKSQSKQQKTQDDAEKVIAHDPAYYLKLSYRVSQTIGQWRLKHHAVHAFWRWVSSWARACRMPSDLGFSDDGFVLPDLVERDHIVRNNTPPPGFLFTLPAFGGHEERQERKRTLKERTEYVAELVAHDDPAVIWCHTNEEADTLEKIIPGSRQVSGQNTDDQKIESYNAFQSGALRCLIIKPKIGAFGLNWQHCAHVVMFATHSYEQYYQSVRRCWRFGQKRPVRLDVVASEGEERVMANMRAKAKRANVMFKNLVMEMNQSTRIVREDKATKEMRSPSWL